MSYEIALSPSVSVRIRCVPVSFTIILPLLFSNWTKLFQFLNSFSEQSGYDIRIHIVPNVHSYTRTLRRTHAHAVCIAHAHNHRLYTSVDLCVKIVCHYLVLNKATNQYLIQATIADFKSNVAFSFSRFSFDRKMCLDFLAQLTLAIEFGSFRVLW